MDGAGAEHKWVWMFASGAQEDVGSFWPGKELDALTFAKSEEF